MRSERILVCIDQVERDARILEYARSLARLSDPKAIYLLHVSAPTHIPVYAPTDSLPVFTDIGYSEPSEQENNSILEEIHKMDDAYLGEFDVSVRHCKKVSGFPLTEILQFAKLNDIDLIIVGRNHGELFERGDKALLARRIVRRATCSVMTLSENFQPECNKIVVPCRDSECSANALSAACEIAAASGGEVEALNVFYVYPVSYQTGISTSDHQDVLQKHAEEECGRLIARAETGGAKVSAACFPDLRLDPVRVILERCKETACDLIVIGARGRTGAAGILLGTVTEQLIRVSPVPVLAIKKKGELIGVLRALQQLMES
ncbi:MAG: universal stress protein [Proteobacteria bacterium]|nr:universal stress protein [Pseudomonadota bacterium]